MGWDTSAMVNIQRRDRRRPKSKVKLFSPYVAMAEPLAAYKEEPRKEGGAVEEGCVRSNESSAPVSTRKLRHDRGSKIRRRRCCEDWEAGPESATAITDWSERFPRKNRAWCT